MCGWSGGAKVSCISYHPGIQLILAHNWARPAILVAGKGGGSFYYAHNFKEVGGAYCFWHGMTLERYCFEISYMDSFMKK